MDVVDSNDDMDGTDLTVVHKQGFLVKRGGRVRTWRKRLFVLDDAGLAYYKTEQVSNMYTNFVTCTRHVKINLFNWFYVYTTLALLVCLSCSVAYCNNST